MKKNLFFKLFGFYLTLVALAPLVWALTDLLNINLYDDTFLSLLFAIINIPLAFIFLIFGVVKIASSKIDRLDLILFLAPFLLGIIIYITIVVAFVFGFKDYQL